MSNTGISNISIAITAAGWISALTAIACAPALFTILVNVA